nr:hypothetical protein [Tanacetum cinerariifolium]
PRKHGVQRRKVIGKAEVAHIPYLLDAVALARIEHRLHGAPVVVVRRFLNIGPANALPHRLHAKLLEVGVVLVQHLQMAGDCRVKLVTRNQQPNYRPVKDLASIKMRLNSGYLARMVSCTASTAVSTWVAVKLSSKSTSRASITSSGARYMVFGARYQQHGYAHEQQADNNGRATVEERVVQ